VFIVRGKSEKIDMKKLNAEDMPTINTHKNIVKNKLHNVLASKGRFEEVDMNAEYEPTINTHRNAVTENIKNAVKESWSALNGSATPLGCKLPTSAHKNLQSLASTPLTR
jgi:hypothetical protein